MTNAVYPLMGGKLITHVGDFEGSGVGRVG